MAEPGAEPVERLADIILEKGKEQLQPTTHVKAPEALANRAIKAAAAALELEEMASSPTHSMRKRDEGGVAAAVQEVAQHVARPDFPAPPNAVVAAVHDRVRAMQGHAQPMDIPQAAGDELHG